MKKIAFIYINTLFAVLFSGFPTMQAQEKALILRLSGASSLTNDLCHDYSQYIPRIKCITSAAGTDTIMVDRTAVSVSAYGSDYVSGFEKSWLWGTLNNGVITLVFDKNPYSRRMGSVIITKSDGTQQDIRVIQRGKTLIDSLVYGDGNAILKLSVPAGQGTLETIRNAVAATSSKPWFRATIKNGLVNYEFDDNLGDAQRSARLSISTSDGTNMTINVVQQGMPYPVSDREDTRIFNWAMQADKFYITNPNSSPLNLYFGEFLAYNSWRSRFFVPTDAALGTYYDEVSSQSQQPRVLSFYYSTRLQDRATPVKARAYSWDPVTNEIGNSVPGAISNPIINNRLKDLLDSHIIVHSDAESATGFGSLNQYYVTEGGSAVKISNTTDGRLTSDFDPAGNNFYVQGGFQIDNDSMINVSRTYDLRGETSGIFDGEGLLHVIDRPIQTTMKSVYSVLSDGAEASPFYQFFNLCQIDADILDRAGLADSVDNDEVESELEKYTIFTSSQNGLTDNVRFFDSDHYTVYVPTNEAIREAIDQGLPTWEQITDVITAGEAEVDAATEAGLPEPEILDITRRYKFKAQAMITYLVNFLKYHFQNNSVFADRLAVKPAYYETACQNDSANGNRYVKVSSIGNGTLFVQSVYGINPTDGFDIVGPLCQVVDDASRKNILTRDYTLSTIATRANNATIETSSYAVVHQIDGVLNFKELDGGRYDTDWATIEAAGLFLEKYSIKE